MPGPLAGIRIIELAGIGPVPFACMMLADHGVEVIRVERPAVVEGGVTLGPRHDIMMRSRRIVTADLKSVPGKRIVRDLIASADGMVEGFRPGVMERLGFGPDEMLSLNPRLVYGRMTGWGQDGPYANLAGHDINYIALTGALDCFGRAGEQPTPPINMLGDFGGGGMMMAFGMVSALLHAQKTGEGQVIDCAMIDGASILMSMVWSYRAEGAWGPRGTNLLDTGAHFYDTYETSDGRYISIGSIEPQFYELLRAKAGLDDPMWERQMDRSGWTSLKDRLAAIFKRRTRDEWCEIMDGHDICFAPVLTMDEAPQHPHNAARGTFVDVAGVTQPRPAPRYSKTQNDMPVTRDGTVDTAEVLRGIGYTAADMTAVGVTG